MFWKKLNGRIYEFIAVTSFRQLPRDNLLYGQRDYEFKLSDGSTETAHFEPEEWQKLERALRDGGTVING